MRRSTPSHLARGGVAGLMLLFVLASPVEAVDTVTDEVGDAATGPDIEQIVITPGDSFITMQIRVTAVWQPTWSMQILLSTDPRLCSTSGSAYTVALPASLLGGTGSGPALLTTDGGGGWSSESPLDHQVHGTAVTISLPRALIGDPDDLMFSVVTWGDPSPFDDVPPDQDHSPDGIGCHSVDVAHVVPDTAMRSANPISTPFVLGVLAALMATVLRPRRHARSRGAGMLTALALTLEGVTAGTRGHRRGARAPLNGLASATTRRPQPPTIGATPQPLLGVRPLVNDETGPALANGLLGGQDARL